MYDLMIWGGAVVTLIGLAGLMWCVSKVNRLRGQDLSENDMRAAMEAVIPLNLGSLFICAIGLMLVVVGIILS